MNYDQIVDLALSYADRSDLEVSSRMDSFLRIVESRISRKLTVMDMSVRSILATTDGTEYYTLPDDFSGLRDVELKDNIDSSSRATLQYMSPEQMNNLSSISANSGVSGVYYTVVTNQLQILPIQPSDKILEIIYYRRVIPLSPESPENWVSLKEPDLYVFGLLVEINSFVKDAEAKALWEQRFIQTLADIEEDDGSARWSGTALQMRIG